MANRTNMMDFIIIFIHLVSAGPITSTICVYHYDSEAHSLAIV